ncbi:PKD domain-containing protein [Saxibacter everestensis]|uniref:PKD domain-containing protein n=1 Tax=Saxibacter everestensis TaxID=2909229 RepID=A0ABY8QWG8_9MICO|nr:PKD domain-containing protein [Brevibacteriaceae bacterium ZFBP1038]
MDRQRHTAGLLVVFVLASTLTAAAIPAYAAGDCRIKGRFNNSCQLHGPERDAPKSPERPRKTQPKQDGCQKGGKSVPCSKKNGYWSDDEQCYGRQLPSQPPDSDGSDYLICDQFNNQGPKLIPPPPTMPYVDQSDFQNFDLKEFRPLFQPDGWTVTQHRTNMYTNAEQHIINMTLLGFPVRVRATPVAFTWNFGDGGTTTTSQKGKPIAQGEDPAFYHVYAKPGNFGVVLTTHYRGEFSVAGGPWIDIDGQAAVPSEAIPIDVKRYHRYGVSENCSSNPAGPDCSPESDD